MSPSSLSNMIVGELMARWPQTIRVFLRRRMKCPGCPMAPFMTVGEAALEYGVPLDELTNELSGAIPCGADEPPRVKP